MRSTALLGLLSYLLCACGSDETEESAPGAEQATEAPPSAAFPIIAICLSDRQEGISSSLRRLGGELGVRVEVREAQGRPSAQWQQYETLVAQGANAVVLQACGQDVLARIRDDAAQRNLPITFLEHGSTDAPVIRSDYASALQRAADRWLGQRVVKGPVRLVLMFDPGWPDRRTRLERILDHLEKRGLFLDVVQELAVPSLAIDSSAQAEDRTQRRKRILRALQSTTPVELILAADAEETALVFETLEGNTDPPSVIGVGDRPALLDRVRSNPARFQVAVPRAMEAARTALDITVRRMRNEAYEAETVVAVDLVDESGG